MSERPLRVAVDARCLNVTHLRGIGKAMLELLKRTSASGTVEWHLLADRPDLPMQVSNFSGCQTELFSTRGYRFHSWEQWSLPRRARQLGVDLLHSPAIAVPWWQPVPTVVNILDTIPWQNQDAFWPAGWYRDTLLPSAYSRSAAVVTISDSSRRDILTRWPGLKPKLHVVSLGVDERYLDAEWSGQPVKIDGLALKDPYLLYLGGAEPRKRLMWALQAWWGSKTPDLSFVVCGLERGAHQAVREATPAGFQERLLIAPYVPEDSMPHLYMHAAAVLYPTLYEGFGLPALEAQAVGTPVLFSDVGSLSELKGPGAVVLPTDDLAAWTDAIDRTVQSRTTVEGCDHVARAWAQQYSWDAFVERTVAVYRSVVGLVT